MKKGPLPGCLGYIRDEILPNYMGIIIDHEIRILIKQPVFQWKVGKTPFQVVE